MKNATAILPDSRRCRQGLKLRFPSAAIAAAKRTPSVPSAQLRFSLLSAPMVRVHCISGPRVVTLYICLRLCCTVGVDRMILSVVLKGGYGLATIAAVMVCTQGVTGSNPVPPTSLGPLPEQIAPFDASLATWMRPQDWGWNLTWCPGQTHLNSQ